MAKAKKSESASTEAKASDVSAVAKAPAKKAPAKKAAAPATEKKAVKSAKPAQDSSVPLIDTGLAAQAAAAMVANHFNAAATAKAGAAESGSFKNLKNSVNQSSPGTLSGILGSGGGQKKFAAGHTALKQGPGGGRNQTFGAAEVSRTGVPRRTGG